MRYVMKTISRSSLASRDDLIMSNLECMVVRLILCLSKSIALNTQGKGRAYRRRILNIISWVDMYSHSRSFAATIFDRSIKLSKAVCSHAIPVSYFLGTVASHAISEGKLETDNAINNEYLFYAKFRFRYL